MIDIIEKHYIDKYGPPVREAKFLPKGASTPIRIFKWDSSQTEEGVTMYATIGSSLYLGNHTEKCEFFIGITPSKDGIAEALAEVCIEGNGSKNIPKEGDSITLSYPIWNGINIKSFLFENGDEIIEPIKISKQIIKFVQLVPIFESELNYKKTFGHKLLWDVFNEKQIPYWLSERNESDLPRPH